MHNSLSQSPSFTSHIFIAGIFLFSVVLITTPAGLRAAPQADSKAMNETQSFSWSLNRPLRWADFQGKIRKDADRNFAAETICGISIKTNMAKPAEPVQVQVSNHFDTHLSWLRPGHATAEVLRHEQGHWDLCEIYTRILQARFDSAHITGSTLHEEVSRIYQSVITAHRERQQQYEDETQHGTIPSAQRRWELLIAEELQKSSQ
ncbi:MAG: DUF922 domain-containing protein [Bacteroidetes bacterium]|nr:DUF922 domain-containing protein [Bacteroidota bacterium]